MWFSLIPVKAQVVSDTLSGKYGPKTTRYRLEKDAFGNIDSLYTLDTSLNGLDINDDFSFRTGLFQNLGNLGTASKPFFWQAPSQIGQRFGYESFSIYRLNHEPVKYWNTYSPSSQIQYLQGGVGRQEIVPQVSHNINASWNVGVTYRRLTSWKQIGLPTTEEKEADHNSLLVSTSFLSKNQRYQLFGYSASMNHRMAETGGVDPQSSDTTEGGRLRKGNLFNYEEEPGRLPSIADSRDRRNDWHLMQQYHLVKQGGLSLYSIIDYNVQKVDFRLQDTSYRAPLFTKTFLSNDRADAIGSHLISSQVYSNFESSFGVKSRLDWALISGYVKQRVITHRGNTASFGGSQETWIGGTVSFEPRKNWYLDVQADYIIGKDYQLNAKMRAGILSGYFRAASWTQTIASQLLNTPILNWNHNWNRSNIQTIGSRIDVSSKTIKFSLDASVSRVGDLVYFGDVAMPVLAAGPVVYSQIDASLNALVVRKWHFDHRFLLAQSSNIDAIRVPTAFVWLRYYYEGLVANKAATVQIGLDLKYLSSWYAPSYMPINQQFFNASRTDEGLAIDAWPQLSPFLSAKIKRAFVWVKVPNALQGAIGPGYFATPLYPAQRRMVSFGVRWYFFD